ncbi:carbon-nitrogen hydrolase family protein [Spongiactinospora rosea]|uniref:Carbon-nitrogen hydrolase family protein n=1 Tax=Spongiactinospora rosea TaxID=2248750 RepID=A0A366LYM5_9ACTN|nr:carbon-nitrogen hydrolase family protein [Spongiactinospora rosea]RBQ18653.1 carbon-nitrogen hydrolase family protein [Spongiactinospora rosea]
MILSAEGGVITIAVAQPVCAPADVPANVAAHAEMIRAARADIVLFPELSLTGYELDAPPISLGGDGLGALALIVEACAATGALALAGAPVEEDGREYIAMLAVDGTAARVAYRKMWPDEAEGRRFTPGPAPAAIEVGGRRLGLAVCRDSGIPRHAADTAALGIDGYLVGALFSPGGAAQRDVRMPEIATEYGVWVAVASYAGATSAYPVTSGGSGVWAPDGRLVTQAGPDAGTFVVAKVSASRRE